MEKRCGICESDQIVELGKLPLYHTGGLYETSILKCKRCKVIYRDFDYAKKEIKNHFSIASYTDLGMREKWKSEREEFFEFIVRLSSKYVELNNNTNVLDFGCAYGHLLESFSKQKVNCFGVELDDKLRRALNGSYCRVSETIGELPGDMRFEIVTLIDSLYYVEDPIKILKEINLRLSEKGIVIIRVTNRAFLINAMYSLFPKRMSTNIFGDSKYSFSHTNMKVLFDRSKFHIEEILLNEEGKKIVDIKRKLFYQATSLISRLPGIKITPGLIYILRKQYYGDGLSI